MLILPLLYFLLVILFPPNFSLQLFESHPFYLIPKDKTL